MQDYGYLIGVLLAVGAGCCNNVGLLLQKKVVNELPEGEKVGRNLLKKPLWILGLCFELVFGTTLFLLANSSAIGIGPSLVPGLMASGLIVLAIGSIKMLKESVKKEEIIGISLMIAAIALLGFSQLETHITEANLVDMGFIMRVVIFTAIFVSIALSCQIVQRKTAKWRGVLLAIFSGCMFATSNFWVAPLIGIFEFGFLSYVLLFVVTCLMLVIVNIFGIFKIQQAFQHGQASNLIPIQQVAIQIGPIFVYFAIFMVIPPNLYGLPFMLIGVALIIISSFLLAKRQGQLEEIK